MDSAEPQNPLLKDVSFNRHSLNAPDWKHVSPFDKQEIHRGVDGIVVKLVQGIDEDNFRRVVGRAVQSTTGIDPENPPEEMPWEEMLKGGLQGALESQVVVFEIAGISRACTHQLVRTRKASFHQQSQRATFMGDNPNVRIPETVAKNPRALTAFRNAIDKARLAYSIATSEDISYQDARYVLPEGSETYIQCEYPLREFIATYAYRGCSMFLWETVHVFREMRRLLVKAHPWLDPYVKISCQDRRCRAEHREGEVCLYCENTGWIGERCTFQGWERVEGQCNFPQAKEELRVYKPDPALRIGK